MINDLLIFMTHLYEELLTSENKVTAYIYLYLVINSLNKKLGRYLQVITI